MAGQQEKLLLLHWLARKIQRHSDNEYNPKPIFNDRSTLMESYPPKLQLLDDY